MRLQNENANWKWIASQKKTFPNTNTYRDPHIRKECGSDKSSKKATRHQTQINERKKNLRLDHSLARRISHTFFQVNDIQNANTNQVDTLYGTHIQWSRSRSHRRTCKHYQVPFKGRTVHHSHLLIKITIENVLRIPRTRSIDLLLKLFFYTIFGTQWPQMVSQEMRTRE